MNIKHVFIDANILIKNYDFKSNEIIQLIKIKDFFDITIYLSQVVYDECIGNYNEEAIKCHASLQQEFQKYRKLLVSIKKTEFDSHAILEPLKKMSDYYKPKLDSFISRNNIKIAPYPKVSHEEIVKRIYDKKLPFGNSSCSEKGYKDFLLLKSISELKNKIPANEDILIYSRNLSDFTRGKQKNEFEKPLPVAEELEVENLYITASPHELLKILKASFKTHAIDISEHQEKISNDIGGAIVKNVIFSDELYGDFLFEPESIKNELFSIMDVDVTLDEESGYFEISGKIKIQFDCDFYLNSALYEERNTEFVFHDKVSKIIKEKGYTDDDPWEINFYDFPYCRTFVLHTQILNTTPQAARTH